jgi:hypothetical protein
MQRMNATPRRNTYSIFMVTENTEKTDEQTLGRVEFGGLTEVGVI